MELCERKTYVSIYELDDEEKSFKETTNWLQEYSMNMHAVVGMI